MLLACWSAKGGCGATVTAAALALLAARRPAGAVLADLAGDQPAVLGMPEPEGPGLAEWLTAGPDVAASALSRLAVDAAPGLRVLPRGGPLPSGPPERLAAGLAEVAGDEVVVADCGTITGPGPALEVAAAATRSLLVLRPCYLAIRRAMAAPVRPAAVVLIVEPERSLGPADVEAVLAVPVAATVPFHPSVARAVDAGLLATRLPRPLARALAHA